MVEHVTERKILRRKVRIIGNMIIMYDEYIIVSEDKWIAVKCGIENKMVHNTEVLRVTGQHYQQ